MTLATKRIQIELSKKNMPIGFSYEIDSPNHLLNTIGNLIFYQAVIYTDEGYAWHGDIHLDEDFKKHMNFIGSLIKKPIYIIHYADHIREEFIKDKVKNCIWSTDKKLVNKKIN